MKKIPCVVLIYYNVEIIKKSLEFLLRRKDMLDIIVVENRSDYTETEIKPFVLDLINKHEVSKYFLFDKNISNNAFEMVFDSGQIDLSTSKYVMLTDGDLVASSQDWLSEELSIIENNPHVFCCAISLNMDNLPLRNYPDAINWIPPDIKIEESYIEARTGAHLLLFRTEEFKDYLKWRNENNLSFRDYTLHRFCYDIISKKWARTLINQAVHLTWDIYNEPNHTYTKIKTSKSFHEIWDHALYSDYEVYYMNSIKRYKCYKLNMGNII